MFMAPTAQFDRARSYVRFGCWLGAECRHGLLTCRDGAAQSERRDT